MTSKVIYKGELRTEAEHLFSKSIIETDAPLDNQGKAERFSPTDLVATALASCMLTVMGIKARDMNINLQGLTCEVEKIMASEPRRISEIVIKMGLPNCDFSEKSKIILERTAHTCPVAKSLHPELKISLFFEW